MPAAAYCRQLLDLSERMLSAGMAQHWDELIALERQRSALLDQAPAFTPDDTPQPLIDLIAQVQACDAQLREKVDAWMTHARILLRVASHSPPTA
jgi:hypothetical protein